MKKNILLFLIPTLFFLSADVYSQEEGGEYCCCVAEANFYADVLTGVNFLQDTTIDGNRATYQAGYVISGLVGYRWDCGLRLEGEYSFRRNDIKHIDFFIDDSSTNGYCQSSSCMANIRWDLPLNTWECSFYDAKPFLGVGIGYDFQQMHSSNPRIVFKQNWRHFSWQLMTGVNYSICSNTEITLEYAFHQGGSRFNNHSLGIGLVYKFGFPNF